MSFDLQIREQITRFCAGEIDAVDLEAWLSAATWEIDQESPATRQLAFDSLRLTSEAANGDWTDEELRDQLKALSEIVTDDSHSVSAGTPSLKAEGFLEQLSAAQQSRGTAQHREADQLAAIMRYAHLGSFTAASSETVRPSDREFLRQPKVENETPHRPPRELAIN